MAGRLGVLRRLEGDEGSLEGAKAESRRSSSRDKKVLVRALALGAGEVRGRRTLLSHAREAGEGAGERLDGACEAASRAAAAAPGGVTASSPMAA